LRTAAGNGTPRVRGNKKSALDPTPPKGKADMTKGANNRSPKNRSPEKKKGAGGQQGGRMGVTPDLLRDDIAPTPTDLGVCDASVWSWRPAHATIIASPC
jgi:hypothetical protein